MPARLAAATSARGVSDMATCEHCGCTHLPVNLDGTSNLFGELGPDVRDRLQAVVAHPDETTWDDAHSVILRDGSNFGLGLTLWQAVCKVDPLFPQTGPVSRWVEDDS